VIWLIYSLFKNIKYSKEPRHLMFDKKLKSRLLLSQKFEISEYFIYRKLSDSIPETKNKKILLSISNDELKHYNIWKKYTQEEVNPSKFLVFKYYLISKIFGLTFGLKLMEKGEEKAQINYGEISKFIPEAKTIIKDENTHEHALLGLLDEERLRYVGSIVLGLNDALVELTGALAGLTLALQNSQLVAMAGTVTGIAASFSMAASEYLSTKSESEGKNPLRASIYTGIAYIFTVLFLIFPYLVLSNLYLSLAWTLVNATIVIFLFTYYISVAKDYSFRKRFLEMASISLGVALLSFGIGFLVRMFFGIEV
jgi:vacuolar iron transporter family protein